MTCAPDKNDDNHYRPIEKLYKQARKARTRYRRRYIYTMWQVNEFIIISLSGWIKLSAYLFYIEHDNYNTRHIIYGEFMKNELMFII